MLELCESRLLKWMPLTVRRSLDVKQQLLLLFLLLLLLLPLIIRRHPVQAILVIDLDIDLKKKKNAERLVWLSPTAVATELSLRQSLVRLHTPLWLSHSLQSKLSCGGQLCRTPFRLVFFFFSIAATLRVQSARVVNVLSCLLQVPPCCRRAGHGLRVFNAAGLPWPHICHVLAVCRSGHLCSICSAVWSSRPQLHTGRMVPASFS